MPAMPRLAKPRPAWPRRASPCQVLPGLASPASPRHTAPGNTLPDRTLPAPPIQAEANLILHVFDAEQAPPHAGGILAVRAAFSDSDLFADAG